MRAAVLRDIDRVRSSSTVDMPSLLARMDELARQVDELPVANAVGVRPAAAAPRAAASAPRPWWEQAWLDIQEEARGLVRVSRIDQPESALLSPDQSFFLRENLKLKLLNARLALLSRQPETARADLGAAIAALRKYFDPSSRRTQAAIAQAQQVQAQLKGAELPRIDETIAAIATAAAGR